VIAHDKLQESSDCICGYEGPDYFGNYDLHEHRDCPIHGVSRTLPTTDEQVVPDGDYDPE
jgi:hypothetical protein